MALAIRRAAAALAAAALSTLAACAGGPAPAPALPGPAVAAPAAAPSADPQPSTPTPTPADPPAVAALPPPGAPTRPRPPDEVRRLLGTPAGVLREWMGDVVFVRRDGAAEIWRYAADSCFLDVFLYRESDGLKVAHIDARSRTTGRVTPQTCYGRLIEARYPKPTS